MSKRLVLVDGMSHIYRAYYAIRDLSNSKGLPTNAIYGFTSMLRKLIQEQHPDYLGVAFDVEGPTVRHEKFEAYKATRKPMPEDLVQQLPYIRRVCEVFCVPVIGQPGYEADDVIGTLAKKAVEEGLSVVVVTSDKDMLQLVSDSVSVLDPVKDTLYDPAKVEEKMGVKPGHVPDVLGLWGDSVDNIPGAPGIGEKGARELIQTFGTLENCLQNWNKVKRKTYQESLRDHADLIRTSKELATIQQGLPVELDLENLVLRGPDRKAAFELFAELEFKSLMREFLDEALPEPVKGEWLAGHIAVEFLKSLAPQPRICFHLGLRQDLFSRKLAEAVCVQGDSGPAAVLDLTDTAVARQWKGIIEEPSRVKVCWDAKLCRLAQESFGIKMDADVEDVMLMAFLTAPHIGDYSLRRLALDELRVSLAEETERQGLLMGLRSEAVAATLCRELDCVRRLYEILSPRLDELGLRRLYREIELPLVPVLADMERVGVKINPATLRALSLEMEKQLADLTSKIYEAAGTEFNINSPKQLAEILFEKLNLPTLKRTRKTGGHSTDQAVLEELGVSYEIPRLILDYRQISKLKSTYVDALPSLIHPDTGRVHTSFNQTGTATGRISSSEPNLQNIPIRTEMGRLIRGAIVPEHGSLLISADYSQVELRVLAHLSEDKVLIDAFLKDQDIHERTAQEVLTEEQRANRIESRRRAKVINFGIVYGISAFGLAQRLGVGREEAQALIDAYFERYKGVRAWVDRTIEEARKTGRVQTLYGRIRPIPDIHSKDYSTRQFAERTAVNSPIQGTAADIIKLAMIRVHTSLREKGLSAKIILQVHDELVVEAPRFEVDAAKSLVQNEMESAATLRVPLRVGLSVADNWRDMK